MLPLIAAAGLNMAGNYLSSRTARRAAERAANTQAGQAGENAALAGELPYRLNPYLQQSAETWSGNVRNIYDEAGNLVMDTAGNAAAGVRGAAGQANTYLDPFYQTGNEANRSLYDLAMSRLNAPEEEFSFSESDPSYQWRLQQGEKALQRSAAARGGLASGNTLRSLMGYGQGMASQEYAAEHARWLAERQANRADTAMWIDPLTGVANRGLTAGNAMGQNLLAGEKYAGDYLTRGAETAGQFRGRGGEYQSNMMNTSTNQQIANILAGENTRMGYMTDRASALAGGQVGAGNAQAQMWSGLFNAAADAATLYGMSKKGKSGSGGSNPYSGWGIYPGGSGGSGDPYEGWSIY